MHGGILSASIILMRYVNDIQRCRPFVVVLLDATKPFSDEFEGLIGICDCHGPLVEFLLFVPDVATPIAVGSVEQLAPETQPKD